MGRRQIYNAHLVIPRHSSDLFRLSSQLEYNMENIHNSF